MKVLLGEHPQMQAQAQEEFVSSTNIPSRNHACGAQMPLACVGATGMAV
ncbi:MAG: hypothetical protein V4713_09880 [Pseudomonadota bacterium]